MLPSRVLYLAKNVNKLAVAAYFPLLHLMDPWFQSQTHKQKIKSSNPTFVFFFNIQYRNIGFLWCSLILLFFWLSHRVHTSGGGKKVLDFFFSTGETILLEWWD